jgi:Ca-activated chloride channel family protein
MKHLILFLISILLASYTSMAQTRKVTGLVTDDKNNPLIFANVNIKGTTTATLTDLNGQYEIEVNNDSSILVFTYIGYQTKEEKVKDRTKINIKLKQSAIDLSEVVVIDYSTPLITQNLSSASMGSISKKHRAFNTESYSTIHENDFKDVYINPLSTFSVDVDGASYSNIRRFINRGALPPKDAVRIEEMINYFNYDYPQPKGDEPFSVNYELSRCLWEPNNLLLHIGLQGLDVPIDDLPPSNIVFLIDVSGSMRSQMKLPLLKQAFKMLTRKLRGKDLVSIVVYAGNSGVVLSPTEGSSKKQIIESLDRLEAGGSTAGGEGLRLAYKIAEKNIIPDGNNRIILATDGDFNIGPSSNAEMERLVDEKREKGIDISVLGFGMGNYKDDKMEIIANKGNGNYAYIDNLSEAKKVLINEFGGTLFTIAKDVKLQLEFNPANVKSYRLIGYVNRLLDEEDFDNDKKDAGEIGAGHTVTALYEIVLKDSDFEPDISNIELKYQKNHSKVKVDEKYNDELLTLNLRYKDPKESKSKLIEKVIENKIAPSNKTSNNFKFSSAVAGLGMLLRDSKYKGDLTYDSVLELAKSAKGEDEEGYRAECISLIENASLLSQNTENK